MSLYVHSWNIILAQARIKDTFPASVVCLCTWVYRPLVWAKLYQTSAAGKLDIGKLLHVIYGIIVFDVDILKFRFITVHMNDQ